MLYATLARGRRRWYARHPEARRALRRPVISVGNLTVGGSGKTPTVAHLARLLRGLGERPAILSRGYARRVRTDGVVVVSDGERVRSDLAHAGDEPLMLARDLPGVGVFVCEDRHLAGCLAERRFGCTVHLLDDGFQHFGLARDVDVVLARPRDLEGDRVLPAGRLREPAAAIADADLVIVPSHDEADIERVRAQVGGKLVFGLRRVIGDARLLALPHDDVGSGFSRMPHDNVGSGFSRIPDDDVGSGFSRIPDAPGSTIQPSDVTRVLAVAGIARPSRFFEGLREAGWPIARTLAFRDHQRFAAGEMRRIAEAARTCGADVVLTTMKDAVRLETAGAHGLRIAAVPLGASVEPEAELATWLASHLREIRERKGRGTP
jgi:tetraacyldisaccharide 4'-kinase